MSICHGGAGWFISQITPNGTLHYYCKLLSYTIYYIHKQFDLLLIYQTLIYINWFGDILPDGAGWLISQITPNGALHCTGVSHCYISQVPQPTCHGSWGTWLLSYSYTIWILFEFFTLLIKLYKICLWTHKAWLKIKKGIKEREKMKSVILWSIHISMF